MSRVNLGAGAPKKSRKKSRKGRGVMPEKFEHKKQPLEGIFGIEAPRVYRGGGMVKKGDKKVKKYAAGGVIAAARIFGAQVGKKLGKAAGQGKIQVPKFTKAKAKLAAKKAAEAAAKAKLAAKKAKAAAKASKAAKAAKAAAKKASKAGVKAKKAAAKATKKIRKSAKRTTKKVKLKRASMKDQTKTALAHTATLGTGVWLGSSKKKGKKA